MVADWLRALEESSLAVTIRRSSWLYPGLEIIHITGITLLVGAAFMFDLRLLGFGSQLPLQALGKHLLAWSKRGLILVVPSGLLLFSTNAEELFKDPVFWTKMLLILVAGLNAWIFEVATRPRLTGAEKSEQLPRAARAAGIVSIVIWIAVIVCGRLLAY